MVTICNGRVFCVHLSPNIFVHLHLIRSASQLLRNSVLYIVDHHLTMQTVLQVLVEDISFGSTVTLNSQQMRTALEGFITGMTGAAQSK